MKPEGLPGAFASRSRVGIAIVLLSLIAMVAVPGCKNGGGGSAELDEGLFSEDLGGDTAESHWVGNQGTGGGEVNLVFFDDEAGQVLFPGGFQPGAGAGVVGRTFYTTTLDVDEDDEVTVSVDGVDYEFEITNIDVSGNGMTFTGRYVDSEATRNFDFTRSPGGINF